MQVRLRRLTSMRTNVEGPVEIPKSVLLLKRRTRTLYLSWWVTHYAVGFMGVIAGAFLTALTSAGLPDASKGGLSQFAWLIGIVAAVCTSLVTFLGPIQKAERYWSAFHILDQACLEYEQQFIELRPFLLRVRQARRILQAVDPDERYSSEATQDLHQQMRTQRQKRSQERKSSHAEGAHAAEPA